MRGIIRLGMGRPTADASTTRTSQKQNVNLRQHEVYKDTDGCAMKTGRRERRSDPMAWCEDGYRVIARRPRSEIYTESVSPERADDIEDFTHGIMPLDRW